MRAGFFIIALIITVRSVISQPAKNEHEDVVLLANNVFHLSEVMLHDVASPPAAGRFYAYAMLGAYETVAALGKAPMNINNGLKNKISINDAAIPKGADVTFCALYAMLEVGRKLMPSGYLLKEKQEQLAVVFRKGDDLSEKELARQIRFASGIAEQVVAYAKKDNYNKLSTYARYNPIKEEGRWFPTPPEYMGAVEPQWKTVNAFFLDSPDQFTPEPATPFSRDEQSPFYQQMKEVYDISNNLTEEQKAIANFWDCNPFAVTYSGHMAIGLKKISPGGHWMSITGIASSKANISFDSAVSIHTLVALTLHDAFISCWNEKYSSNRIRPEGAINKLLDQAWRPLLQTPPFPEYTSGHSVVSSASSIILTSFFGKDFSFTDTSEMYFGLPERNFNSFEEAAREAAISRLYGGIHFRDACENGVRQGTSIATFILNKLNAESGK